MACGLAARGARVALLGRNQEKGTSLAERIRQAGGRAAFVYCDVTDRDRCEQACRDVTDRWRGVDVLVNAAGGNDPQATANADLSFFDLPPEALQNVLQLNLLGTLIPTQVFGRQIAEAGAGSVINISSMSAFRPMTQVVAYSAAKAAITNFTHWLSVYMCHNISPRVRVNAIAPGFFLTEQNRYLLTDEVTGKLTVRGDSVIDGTPMGRFGEPDELLGTLLWLISRASQFVTGIVVPVDGGFSAFSGV
jgi:NAD(P)-dependent dehydrogenase (short-subunit alcohol dehydrogenase family)